MRKLTEFIFLPLILVCVFACLPFVIFGAIIYFIAHPEYLKRYNNANINKYDDKISNNTALH